MGDLWRFNLVTDTWENMEVYGITTVQRTLTMWNGATLRTTVPPDQKLKTDLPNMKVKRVKDLDPGEEVELPKPRAGAATVIIGNPPDYILMFGGSTEEKIKDSDSNVNKIKETLNDMWVYNTEDQLWSQMFINSVLPPRRDMAAMASVKTDRLLLMYGG